MVFKDLKATFLRHRGCFIDRNIKERFEHRLENCYFQQLLVLPSVDLNILSPENVRRGIDQFAVLSTMV